MSPYDLAMIGVVIAGMIWGALRGITWQLASIASLVLGYAISFPMSSQLAPHFPGEPVVARALAMLTLYVAVSGGIFLAAWSIRTILRSSGCTLEAGAPSWVPFPSPTSDTPGQPYRVQAIAAVLRNWTSR